MIQLGLTLRSDPLLLVDNVRRTLKVRRTLYTFYLKNHLTRFFQRPIMNRFFVSGDVNDPQKFAARALQNG